MIERTSITCSNAPVSLSWQGDTLVDWVAGGNVYHINGEFEHKGIGYAYKFDSAIQSEDGKYAVIYERLGTKALLLKSGEILRELNRSFYQAHVYEYPISFLKLPNGELSLVHCPTAYNLIEIEAVESEKKITSTDKRDPSDCFHARFRSNPSGTFLLNTGWVWHPYGIMDVYDIAKGIQDNSIFDNNPFTFPVHGEVCSADFLTDDVVVIATFLEDPLDEAERNNLDNLYSGQIGLYSLSQGKILKKITVDYPLGRIVPIDENFVIDLFEYPKLIELNTGKIKQKFEGIFSGHQNSAIIHHLEKIPPIAIDRTNRRIAIGSDTGIELLELK
ncbi:MAG: hypothetical protein AAGA10_06665 [Bacteroidota bacterium]